MFKYLLYVLVLLFTAKESFAQKQFSFASEIGAIQPIPIFYKGIIDSDSNKISVSIGFSALISCNWHYDRKSFLSLGVYYKSYKLDIKEFVRFPIDIPPDGIPNTNPSFFYSNFDVRDLGVRISFGNTISQKIKLNTGFQLSFPLNHHFGYIYDGTKDMIYRSYDYDTNHPFSLFANVAYQWYETKILAFTLIPEFAYNLQKDAKTYIHENQIRKMYFALRVGVGLK